MDADESSEASKYENEMTDLDLLRNNLEDSCVMVDEDNELGFVSHKGSRKTSYKVLSSCPTLSPHLPVIWIIS